MSDLIGIDVTAMASVLSGLETAAEEFDTALADFPVEVDAGAASVLISDMVGELIDASLRLVGEVGTLVERAEGALADLSEFDHTTGSALSRFTEEMR